MNTCSFVTVLIGLENFFNKKYLAISRDLFYGFKFTQIDLCKNRLAYSPISTLFQRILRCLLPHSQANFACISIWYYILSERGCFFFVRKMLNLILEFILLMCLTNAPIFQTYKHKNDKLTVFPFTLTCITSWQDLYLNSFKEFGLFDIENAIK